MPSAGKGYLKNGGGGRPVKGTLYLPRKNSISPTMHKQAFKSLDCTQDKPELQLEDWVPLDYAELRGRKILTCMC